MSIGLTWGVFALLFLVLVISVATLYAVYAAQDVLDVLVKETQKIALVLSRASDARLKGGKS